WPKLLSRVPAEEATRKLDRSSFDLIVSIASMQHTRNPRAALAALDALLRPGGRMLHQIDFSDVGLFSARGYHPLTFLTVRGPVYRAMTSHLGTANRVQLPQYRDMFTGLGYEVDVRITKVVGDDEKLPEPRCVLQLGRDYGARHLELLANVRPRLARPFRDLTDDELLAEAAFIAARKPRD